MVKIIEKLLDLRVTVIAFLIEAIYLACRRKMFFISFLKIIYITLCGLVRNFVSLFYFFLIITLFGFISYINKFSIPTGTNFCARIPLLQI